MVLVLFFWFLWKYVNYVNCVNKKNKIRQVNKKKKKMSKQNKKKSKTQGGVGWNGECWIEIWGPLKLQPRWLFLVAYACADSRVPWSSCLALGSALMDAWQAEMWGLWCASVWNLHRKALGKITWEIWGDLGIEPRSQRLPSTLPATTPILRVCTHNRNKRIYEISALYAGKTQKGAPCLNGPLPGCHAIIIFVLKQKNTGK